MHVHVQAIADSDSSKALATLKAQLRHGDSPAPDFVAIYASVVHDADVLSTGLSDLEGTAIHGGTSCLGVMAGGKMVADDNAGIGIFALWDADGAFGTGMAELGDDPQEAARKATALALAAAGRPGEAPDLVWLTASPGAEEALVAGIEDVVGDNTPIVGGSAADNDVSGNWKVFDGKTVAGSAIVVSVLFPSQPLGMAYQSGYAPTGTSGTVTSVEGRRVFEIDNQPAVDVYRAWTDGAVAPDTAAGSANILSDSTFHPLGRLAGTVGEVPFHLLAHPATAHPDGSIELFADVNQGEVLHLMTGSPDSLVRRAGRLSALAAQGTSQDRGKVAGALVIFCAGCMLAVRDRMDDVAAEVDQALHGAPSLGIFTFGEQGSVLGDSNRHGNLMISCVAFPG